MQFISSPSTGNSSAAAAAAPAAPAKLQRSSRQRKPLETIQEQPGKNAVARSYVGSSGCKELFYTQASLSDEDDEDECPKHGLNYNANCHVCANHQCMAAKQSHEVEEQTALELSFDNSSIIFHDGRMQCSEQGDELVERCPACRKLVGTMEGADQEAQA